MDDISVMKSENVDYLGSILLDEDRQLQVMPYRYLKKFNRDHLRLFAFKNGIYNYPTIELANWLWSNFDMTNAIEIGAGNGALAKYMQIPATDSRMHDLPEVRMLYAMSGQPTVQYGENIIHLDARDAIRKYKPDTVIAQWVTHKYNEKEHDRRGSIYGIEEEFILDNVNTYIMVGNSFTHKKKPILKYPHEEYKFEWVLSRAKYPDLNTIYVWRSIEKEPEDEAVQPQ